MVRQKVPKGQSSKLETTDKISDPRFSSFNTDPRFRLPSKKQARTKIDKRFSALLKDDDFSNSAKVDRYGRKLSTTGKKKALERLYVPDQEEADDTDEDTESDAGPAVELEDDEVVEKELRRAEAKYDPARGGGFSSSSEDEDEDEEEAELDDDDQENFPDMRAEKGAVEMGEVSTRFAVVNMDWDNVRATDLMAVFNSFVPQGGRIEKVSVYQSDFGRERMEREELEGPPKEIFAVEKLDSSSNASESESDDEDADEKIKNSIIKEDDGKEFDSAALRSYQLERLRYYYAVVVCSDTVTAQTIYEATDGSEYLSSANFFDLRFIPDGTDFDERPRDECDTVPTGYKPTEFVTTALQHSKVKLTWDMTPDEASRKDAIKRAFTGSRADINENDLRAYLGSESEDESENDLEDVSEAQDAQSSKPTKKDLARQKMRAALGLADEPSSSSKGKGGAVGDMQITFTAGLSAGTKSGVFENEPILEETTAEKYIRKERERKARRKDKVKALREGRDPDAQDADEEQQEPEASQDLGFDDPFFAAGSNSKEKSQNTKASSKEERLKRREEKNKQEAARQSEKAELELLMEQGGAGDDHGHFDIDAIHRAEKAKGKKHAKSNKGKNRHSDQGGAATGLQPGFEMNVEDDRFRNVFESHEFAIDPSNPRFKGTEGMKKLLAEGRRKRVDDGSEDTQLPKKRRR